MAGMTPEEAKHARIHNRWPIAREGLPFVLIALAVTVLFFFAGFFGLGVFAGMATLFTLYFFRDPERQADISPKAILSAADGRVLEVTRLERGRSIFEGPAVKVSVFMSVFNVHVNRIPVSGRISKIDYHPGRFLSANLDKASEENENNCLTLEADDGRKILFVQIAGLIARRIACWVQEGDGVQAGQRFGLVRFGSRLDMYFPEDSRITTKSGDRVKAGETVIGYLS